MIFYVARHGESLWNHQNRIQGRSDSALTARGIKQSHALAAAWRESGIDKVVSSPLGRAQQTAAIIAATCGCPAQVDDRLVERDFGSSEGRFRAELDFLAGSGGAPTTDRLACGETTIESGKRLIECIERLAGEGEENAALGLVTHNGCIEGMLGLLYSDPSDTEKYGHFNCGYSVIRISDGGLSVVNWGLSSHIRQYI